MKSCAPKKKKDAKIHSRRSRGRRRREEEGGGRREEGGGREDEEEEEEGGRRREDQEEGGGRREERERQSILLSNSVSPDPGPGDGEDEVQSHQSPTVKSATRLAKSDRPTDAALRGRQRRITTFSPTAPCRVVLNRSVGFSKVSCLVKK